MDSVDFTLSQFKVALVMKFANRMDPASNNYPLKKRFLGECLANRDCFDRVFGVGVGLAEVFVFLFLLGHRKASSVQFSWPSYTADSKKSLT